MKISVCITVFNEEKYITKLLDSLLNQTIKPYEIVVVDGGSTDKTWEILRHFAKKYSLFRIIRQRGSIAVCRNLSIELSRGNTIAITDAGCTAKKDWLEKITKPFIYKNVGLVAGYYEMFSKNNFQTAASYYLGIPETRYDPKNFIPSARSVAFKKSVWEEVGGFNEKLKKGGEDTEFFYKCVKHNVKIVRAGKARVEWIEMGDMDLKTISEKFFVYAFGDGQANIWWHPSKQLSSHNIKISLIFIRYFIFIMCFAYCIFHTLYFGYFVFFVFLYLIWPVWKWRDTVDCVKTAFYLPFIQIISDINVMRGFIKGTLKRK